MLLEHDYLPVISSLGADDEGRVFNINADTIAAEIAVHLEAEKLILLSDVDGIYLRPGEPRRRSSRACRSTTSSGSMADGMATGGMIPKLQIDRRAAARGVGSAHIINGSQRNALLSEVFTDEGTGTMIVK